MSLYAQYYFEKHNCRTIENENGFMVYHILDKEFFIREYYISLEKRGTKVHSYFFDKAIEIAKASGCEFISCGVNIKFAGSTEALSFILRQGFELNSLDKEFIILTRGLEDGWWKSSKESD